MSLQIGLDFHGYHFDPKYRECLYTNIESNRSSVGDEASKPTESIFVFSKIIPLVRSTQIEPQKRPSELRRTPQITARNYR